jgi:hypothetical protein
MFNIFRKKNNYDELIAAARGIMANDSLIEHRKPMSWDDLSHTLIKKYDTIAEAEAEHLVSHPELGDKPVPFGFNNDQWRELLSTMQDGDDVWTFSTSETSWDNGCGRSGISIVRDGKEIYHMVTRMN